MNFARSILNHPSSQNLNALRDGIKKKDAAITELHQAVDKLQMAVNLGCKPSEIAEKFVDVPKSLLPKVIGKGGSNIKEVESNFKVRCDVMKEEMKVRSNKGRRGGRA